MLPLERRPPNLGTEGDVVVKRVLAFAIDAIGFYLLLGVAALAVASVSTLLGDLVLTLGTVLFFLYFIYFESEYGATVGKMLTNIVVVTEDGDPISRRQAAIRTLLRIVDWFPYPLHIIGLVAIYATRRKQRVGDIVADTIVVESKRKSDRL